ncbi:MAG: acyl carrier protein [Candidatus Electrothrix sp. YB6]
MQKSEYYNVVDDFIVEHFLFGNKHNLEGDSSLLENGIIDSTGVLEVISFLEEKFQIKIQGDEIIPENLDSINNICHFLDSKIRCAG